MILFFYEIIKTCRFLFWEKVAGFSEQSNGLVLAVVGAFWNPCVLP